MSELPRPSGDSQPQRPGRASERAESEAQKEQEKIQRQLDEALAESFPASDPVSIVTSHEEEDWGKKTESK